VHSVFHYIPQHSAPAVRKFARAHGELPVTDGIANRLLRLPMWVGLEDRQTKVIQAVLAVLGAFIRAALAQLAESQHIRSFDFVIIRGDKVLSALKE